ncbi:hypothetical protein T484DRAFT_1930985 [Baffinella frigidus]|nr:hypothetical protein T484DRAFT_1930985 [Cryptophyta sp. CCMP2293]|mmetsp:Transcript_28997/g.69196  ORF Transcript_28997/g.69196 Transcript_28997/m.69196 type:complete len:135 (+) Transcript_28997:93-497(+)
MTSSTFAIIGKNDNPLYELVWSQKKEEPSVHQQNQFFLHAALDIVDEEIWKNASLYLKTVDKFNDRSISAYVTPTHAKMLLLHDGKSEDSVRSFFNEVHELYLKTILNPFQDQNGPITSSAFDLKVKAVARKYL